MKTLFKVLALGMLLTMLGVVSAFAQDPNELEKLFNQYKVDRKQPCGQRDAALATAKTIVEKFGSDQDNQQVIEYVKNDSAKIAKDDPECKRNDAYNAAYKAKDWAKFISLSKEIIAAKGNDPLALDVMLTMVSVGYDQAVAKVDTYNTETISYAKQAIQRIESGGTSSTGKWGVFAPFQTKDFADGKTNALNGLNYMIGWINYNRPGGNKKDGIVYLYKSTQYNGEFKKDYTIYTSIGDYYFDEAGRLDKEYRAIRAANENKETDEAKAKLALARGFADRGIDAFGRAKQMAVAQKATKAVEGIGKTLTELYKFRFNLAPTAATPDLDKYVAGLNAKPMPDPSTEPTPVVEEVAPTTTTGTSSTTPTTTTPPTTTTSTTTKPAATTTKPAATATTTKPAATTTTTKTTTPAKTTPKKKGTR